MNIETILSKIIDSKLKAFTKDIISKLKEEFKSEENPKMSLSEASKFLGLSEGNLKNKFQNGIIKGYKPVKEIYFFKDDLIAYIKSKGSNELIREG